MAQTNVTEIKVTHSVFKHEDIQSLPTTFRNELANIAYLIRKGREAAKKNPMPQYIVLNTDENPQMVNEIAEVMKRYNKWG